MKRILSLILIPAILMSLCACGNGDAVRIVEQTIDRIGQVTLDSENIIVSAQEAYFTLTEKEKALVSNYDILLQAVETFDRLKEEDRLSRLSEQRWINISDCDILTFRPDYTGTHQVYQLTGTMTQAQPPACEESSFTFTADDLAVTIGQSLVLHWDGEASIPTLTADDGSAYVRECDYTYVATWIRREAISYLLAWERWVNADGSDYIVFRNGSTGTLVNTQRSEEHPVHWQMEDNDSVGVQYKTQDGQTGVLYADLVKENGKYILRVGGSGSSYLPEGRYQPPAYRKTPPRIVSVVAAYGYSLVLRADGTVMARGNNKYGQCNVSQWHDIIAISGVGNHSLGLMSNGTVVATGSNDLHQCEVSDWADITAISAGFFHSVGLKRDGTVVSTGDNSHAQRDISDWKDIVAISAGSYHTVGLKSDGTVVAVGYNEDGRCDVSAWTDIIAVSAGFNHTLGLKSDGTVVSTGDNSHGQCDTAAWTNIASVSAGYLHSLGAKSDGTVAAAGSNEYNQCAVTGWKGVTAVAGGGFHSIGLRADGTLFVIGLNSSGQSDLLLW